MEYFSSWLLRRILLIFCANSPKGQAQTKLRKSSYARNHRKIIQVCAVFIVLYSIFYPRCIPSISAATGLSSGYMLRASVL